MYICIYTYIYSHLFIYTAKGTSEAAPAQGAGVCSYPLLTKQSPKQDLPQSLIYSSFA